MRWSLLLLTWLFAAHAIAQNDAGTVGGGEPTVSGGEPTVTGDEPSVASEEVRLHEPGAEFRWQPPPDVGACIGGSCGVAPPTPRRSIPDAPPPVGRRERFATTGAVLGVVSAGLVLGSSIAIAVVDDVSSERITRGVWLGTLTVSTGLVALSAHLAFRELGGSSRSRAARSIGWTAFALAVADGAILWAGAFRSFHDVDALTIGAGVLGVCALLPHALDAYVAARGLRTRNMASLEPLANGLRVRF